MQKRLCTNSKSIDKFDDDKEPLKISNLITKLAFLVGDSKSSILHDSAISEIYLIGGETYAFPSQCYGKVKIKVYAHLNAKKGL